MSDKMTCPGCDSESSGLMRAYRDGEPCPYCGLPAEAIRLVHEAQDRHADAELTEAFQEAVVRAGNAEAEVRRLTRKLLRVRQALRDET